MNYLEKLYRAVILDSELYEEVEADKSLTRQALMTVALVAIIEGIFSLGAQDQGLFLGLSQSILVALLDGLYGHFLSHLSEQEFYLNLRQNPIQVNYFVH
jgi:hypothetical protein